MPADTLKALGYALVAVPIAAVLTLAVLGSMLCVFKAGLWMVKKLGL